MVDFEVCLGSLSWWNAQPHFNFNVWTDLQTLEIRNIWWNPFFLLLVQYWATQAQSIMDPPPCLTVAKGVLLYKGVTLFSPKDTFFGGYILVTFWFCQSNIVPKCFSMFCFVYFRCLILCSGGREGFFLATVPCRSLLFKVHFIVVLCTARLMFATPFCSYFAVMCGFFWAFPTRSQAILSEHFLALTSAVPFIFHY